MTFTERLTALKMLEQLSYEGPILDGITALTRLRMLNIVRTTGRLPAGIGALNCLEELHLEGSELNGMIFDSIALLAIW